MSSGTLIVIKSDVYGACECQGLGPGTAKISWNSDSARNIGGGETLRTKGKEDKKGRQVAESK